MDPAHDRAPSSPPPRGPTPPRRIPCMRRATTHVNATPRSLPLSQKRMAPASASSMQPTTSPRDHCSPYALPSASPFHRRPRAPSATGRGAVGRHPGSSRGRWAVAPTPPFSRSSAVSPTTAAEQRREGRGACPRWRSGARTVGPGARVVAHAVGFFLRLEALVCPPDLQEAVREHSHLIVPLAGGQCHRGHSGAAKLGQPCATTNGPGGDQGA